MNKHRAIAFGLGLTVLALGAGSAHAQSGPATGFPGIDKFRVPGPETVAVVPVGACTRYLPPMGPARSRGGMGWANGTGATPGTYDGNNPAGGTGILGRVASYGTLVTAANTTQSGTGVAVAQCMDELAAARSDSNGRFATSGHSQGGSGGINAARILNMANPATTAVVTCPVQLDGTFTATSNAADLLGTQNGPAVIICGGSDNLAPCTSAANGDGKFNGATVPVVRISIIGATHTMAGSPVGDGALNSALVTACVEAALDGDPQATAALRPGGAMDNNVINRVARRNFQDNPNPGPGLEALAAALGAIVALLQLLGGLSF